MKVLHVIDSLGVGGGSEHSLAMLLPLLRERGVDSTIACILPREGGLQAQLGDQGFAVEIIPSRTWPGRVLALRRMIKAHRPDLVHATLFHSCVITRLACTGLRVAQLNSLVGTPYDPVRIKALGIAPWRIGIVRLVDALTARFLGGHFHAVTEAVRTEARTALHLDPSRVTVIPRGRSAEHFGDRTEERRHRVRQSLGLDDDVPVLLSVGRQDNAKGQDDLVRAFALVLERHPCAVLLIAGREGDASASIQRAIEETGVGGSIRMLGHRTDAPDLYAATDVFVIPSIHEGIGGCIIEAMAVSTPVIGSDAPAIREMLGDGEYGPVVPRRNDPALAAAIADLLDDPVRRTALGQAGRKRFLEEYELHGVADSMAALYTRLVAAR